jgi:hypothetical protein
MTDTTIPAGNGGTDGHGHRATSPLGTAAARLARAWRRATEALGYALTTREMAAHWDTYGEGPAPQPLSNTAQNLAKNGTLLCVLDRPGRRRYVHRDLPDVPPEPPAADHFEAAVLAALHDAATTHQRYVTTRDVTAAMLAGGYVDALTTADKTRIAWLLEALARPVQQRVAPFASVPGPVTRADTQRFGAEDPKRATVRWWRPTHLLLPTPHPATPGTRREAGIRAVEAARAALGRPATTEEVELWIAATTATDPAHPVVLTLGGEQGLGRALASATGFIDRTSPRGKRGVPDSGLARVTTPFTAGRLLPPRVALDPVRETERQRALATDLALALRPGQELAHLDWLAAQPGGDDPALRDLAALRVALIRQEVARHLPPSVWADALAHLPAALGTLEGWLAQLQGRKRWSGLPRRFRRILSARQQDTEALTTLLTPPLGAANETAPVLPPIPARFADLAPLAVVGQAATAPTATEGRVIHDGLVALLGATGQSLHPVLRRARRVPPPPGAAWTRATPMAVAVKAEHLERVDALAAAVDHVGLPHVATVVGDAVGLLGSTLRDARAVERVLDSLPRRHGWAIRGLLVASGLLGVAPNPDRWLPHPEDAPAGVYATILADPPAASAVLRGLLTRPMPSASRHVVSDALAQVRAGEWLAAIG